jgi:hypothetical protein
VEIPGRGVNLLVQGDSLCGKSSFVGGLVERLAATHDAVCVIDPEGDYGVLGQIPGARVVAVARSEDWSDVLDALRWSTPVVADLSAVPHPAQAALANEGLARLRRSRERSGLPHWIVVDEAHHLLAQPDLTAARVGLDAKGVCLATYRASWLPPAVVAAMDAFVVGRTTEAAELAFVEAVCRERTVADGEIIPRARDLEVGAFLMIRAGAPIVTFTAPPRAIRHVRHRVKYLDHGVPDEQRFRFLAPGGWDVIATAGTLHELAAALPAVPAPTLAHHAGRGDFSRWIRDVFQDDRLADRVAKLERRWCRGDLADFTGSVGALIEAALSTLPAP